VRRDETAAVERVHKQAIQRNTDCPEEQVNPRIPRKSKSWRFAQSKTVLRAALCFFCPCHLWLKPALPGNPCYAGLLDCWPCCAATKPSSAHKDHTRSRPFPTTPPIAPEHRAAAPEMVN
jgi:hypothetical protein